MGETTQEVVALKVAVKELETQIHALTKDVIERQEDCDLKVSRLEKKIDSKQDALSNGTKITILLAFLTSLATSVYNVASIDSVSKTTVDRLDRIEARQSGYNKLILEKLDDVREKPFTSDDGLLLKQSIEKDYIARFNRIWNQVHKQKDEINELSRR